MKGVDVTEQKPLTRSKIGVLMGGQSSEREVSLKTGEAVYRSLVRSGYDAVAIDVGPDLVQDVAGAGG
jgi:D-alanine-D-alanine ligase